MESTYEEKRKECERGRIKWTWVVIAGMIPILITGMHLCLNVTNYQVLESQSTIIFAIFIISFIVSAIGMGVSTSYSNKESALQFEETLRLLDDIGSKFKENKK
jgi:hypothetical protein